MTSSLQGLHSLLSRGQTLRPAAAPPARAAAAAPARAAAAAELSALFSRRAFALGGAFLPFLAAPPPIAAGEMLPVDEGNGPEEISQKLFLDISIDGEPAGRIVIGLYGAAVPGGAARFASLVSGEAGASYRRKPFTKIMPGYVLHGGVVSYSGGAAVDALLGEWEAAQQRRRGTGNLAAAVGIVVRDPSMPPPKLKLVAKKGKLEIDEEEVGTRPNGTEFVISTKDSPELDESSLVVGRVLTGMEVVERIAAVKTVKENSSSPYFRAAKLIGDKRAVVAERGFNRPYSKVLVTNCGLLD